MTRAQLYPSIDGIDDDMMSMYTRSSGRFACSLDRVHFQDEHFLSYMQDSEDIADFGRRIPLIVPDSLCMWDHISNCLHWTVAESPMP